MDTGRKTTTKIKRRDNQTGETSGVMDANDFLVITRAIDAVYLSHPLKDATKREEYYQHIRDLPYRQVLDTLKNHIKSCRFPPTIEELRGEMVASSSETVKKHPRPQMELTDFRKKKISEIRQDYSCPAMPCGMSREEFNLLYRAINSLYAKNALTDWKRRAVWYELLKDIPYMRALENLLAHAGRCPYAPTVAELRGERTAIAESERANAAGLFVRQNSFNNFHQREYDWEEMERKLLNC